MPSPMELVAMEYLGLAGVWKKFEGFTVSDDAPLVFGVIAAVALLIFAVNWLSKKK